MNRIHAFHHRWVFLLLVLAISLVRFSAAAQSVQHLSKPYPGGMPGYPVITGISQQSNVVVVTWDGPSGYYQLYEKRDLADPQWRPVGGPTNLSRRAFVSASSNALFRISGPAPHYAGWQNCAECHQPVYDTVTKTAHSQAFNALKAVGQSTNSYCLLCHTVGASIPTGFTNFSSTPFLAGVQCENCHGVAGKHAANPDDTIAIPRIELAGTVCGGCHTTTYGEWQGTGHATVVEDMNPPNRIDSCGRCHSGSVREALLEGDPLPVGDANVPIVCATCHDSHTKTDAPYQLLSPLYSTNNYFITTSGSFISQYDPNINLCAQCHNHRGAVWTSTSRPPHNSPQYNMLLGNVGELPAGSATYDPSTHALAITNQCVGCHMQTGVAQDQFHPATHTHTFQVNSFDRCTQCHGNQAEGLLEFTALQMTNLVTEVYTNLNNWALTKAPPALSTKYGTRAWEYTTPGELSPGGPGPDATEQALIPTPIQKARFNLYLVFHDASWGAHNGQFAFMLLNTANDWVRQQLNQ
jgi:hypothetical protein